MKHKKCYLIVAVFLLLFSGVASAQIEISPSTIDLGNLISGDTVIRQINITWRGETAVVGFIGTEILPDGDGIAVTYSENPVILYPDITKTLDMTINTSINLMSNNYTIETVVLTEVEEIIEYIEGKTIYKYIEVENLTRIDELILIIQQLQDKINETTDYADLLPLISAMQNATADLIKTIEDALEEEPDPEKEEFNWLIIVILLLIGIVCLLVLFLSSYSRFLKVLKKLRAETQVKVIEKQIDESVDDEKGLLGPK